jgi:hypothetical protein
MPKPDCSVTHMLPSPCLHLSSHPFQIPLHPVAISKLPLPNGGLTMPRPGEVAGTGERQLTLR